MPFAAFRPFDALQPFRVPLGLPFLAALFKKAALDLNFAKTKTLDSRVTFTRASSGTYFDANGVMQTAGNDVARFDHNPVTGESLGLLVEVQRTNLLLNSATLATQNVTVTAAAHTLSFYGTGTVTLSGVSTAGPLVGTGANNRVTLTFTPTAGTLTCTVSGTVEKAQLELGAFATSYIPTTAAQVTRAVDMASMTGTNFSSWWNPVEGAVFAEGLRSSWTNIDVNGDNLVTIDGSGGANRINSGVQGNPRSAFRIRSGNADLYYAAQGDEANFVNGQTVKQAIGIKNNDFAFVSFGATRNTPAVALPATFETWSVGRSGQWNGWIKRLTYWPTRLPNATLEALTSD